MTAALEGGEWSAARPGRILPSGKTRYAFCRRLGGPQSRSGRAENLVPTGIRSPDRPARSQSLYRLSYRVRSGKAVRIIYNVCVCVCVCVTVVLVNVLSTIFLFLGIARLHVSTKR